MVPFAFSGKQQLAYSVAMSVIGVFSFVTMTSQWRDLATDGAYGCYTVDAYG